MTISGDDGADGAAIEGQWHRRQAVEANNSVWELLDGSSRSPEEIDQLLSRAYAASYHWSRATGRGPQNAARASWLLSRCHAVLGHGDLALHHADRCSAIVTDAGLQGFDLGYAHEARARSLACLGRLDDAATEHLLALATEIPDPDDRSLFRADLAAEPWFGLPLPASPT